MIDMKEFYWVVGMFEGEGCFQVVRRGIYNNRCQIMVQIRSTDRDVLERVREILKIGYISNPMRGTNKPIYTYSVQGKIEAIGLLMTMYPLLGKRRQAKAREVLSIWQECPIGKGGDGRGSY